MSLATPTTIRTLQRKLYPASERGSIMPIASTVTHAGIVKVKRYGFSMA